jgi:hypothetical protein
MPSISQRRDSADMTIHKSKMVQKTSEFSKENRFTESLIVERH